MTQAPQARDFLETQEGLMFAVVAGGLEDRRALGFLRYRRDGSVWRKLDSGEANALLAAQHPHYLYYSAARDAQLHGIPMACVAVHHRPRRRLAQLLRDGAGDAVEAKLLRLLSLLAAAGADLASMGVTGSLLIGAQRPDSDFDLVIYQREAFFQVRQTLIALLDSGQLEPLSETLWADAYERRAGALDYAEYLRHEKRKFNKAAFEGSKFDITLTLEDAEPPRTYRKQGHATITARVLDAGRAFDHPARYVLDHPEIGEALSYTHTYTGQAWPGETVEIAGQVERCDEGRLRIVVGSNGREALGEYLRLARET